MLTQNSNVLSKSESRSDLHFKRSLCRGVPEWVRVDQLGYCNSPGQNCWNSKGSEERPGEEREERRKTSLRGEIDGLGVVLDGRGERERPRFLAE